MAKRKLKRRTLTENLRVGETWGLINIARLEPEIEYMFRHALIQNATYHSVLKKDRQMLHAAVADTLERVYPDRSDELAATLAHHYQLAGQKDRAVRWFDRAIDVAMAGYANSVAESLCRETLTLAESESDKASLYSKLGRVLSRQSRFEDAIGVWQQAIDLYRNLGDSDSACYLYARSGRARYETGEIQRALADSLQALESIKDGARNAGMAALLHEAARAYYFNGFSDKAKPLVEQALAMARECGSREIEADALCTYGILPNVGPKDCLTALEAAAELAERCGYYRIALRSYNNLAITLNEMTGQLHRSIQCIQRALELARRIGSTYEVFFQTSNLLPGVVGLGDINRAANMLDQLDEAFRNVPQPEEVKPLHLFSIANVRHHQGDWETAYGLCVEGEVDLRKRGDHQSLRGNLNLQGGCLNEMGEFRQAQAVLQDCLEGCQDSEYIRVAACICLSTSHLGQHHLEEARQALDEAVRLSEHWPDNPLINGLVKLGKGQLAAAESQKAAADTEFSDAVSLLKSTDDQWRQAYIIWKWGEAMRRLDGADDPHACDLLEQAAAEFEAMGAPLIAAQIRGERAPIE